MLKQLMRNTVAKKRVGQEEVDSDYLFANRLQRRAFRLNPVKHAAVDPHDPPLDHGTHSTTLSLVR